MILLKKKNKFNIHPWDPRPGAPDRPIQRPHVDDPGARGPRSSLDGPRPSAAEARVRPRFFAAFFSDARPDVPPPFAPQSSLSTTADNDKDDTRSPTNRRPRPTMADGRDAAQRPRPRRRRRPAFIAPPSADGCGASARNTGASIGRPGFSGGGEPTVNDCPHPPCGSADRRPFLRAGPQLRRVTATRESGDAGRDGSSEVRRGPIAFRLCVNLFVFPLYFDVVFRWRGGNRQG